MRSGGDGVSARNPSRPDKRSGHARMVSAPARRESARLAKTVSVAQKTAPPRQWSVRGTTGKTKARRLSTRGCWLGAGSASGDRRRPDPPDRRTAFRGGVGYEHECSRRLPLLRCPPLMMIIIGGESLPAGFEDGSAYDDPAGLGAGRRREEGFQRGKLKGGEPDRRSRRMGRRGCSPHRRGAGGLRERGARPAPPGRRRLRRADCGKGDGRRPERGERVAVITCGTGGASGRGGSAPGARAAWCRR